jgi:hypothetical protein
MRMRTRGGGLERLERIVKQKKLGHPHTQKNVPLFSGIRPVTANRTSIPPKRAVEGWLASGV